MTRYVEQVRNEAKRVLGHTGNGVRPEVGETMAATEVVMMVVINIHVVLYHLQS